MPRPKSYRRQDVIKQALAVFWKKGFEAASLSNLVAATGLNKKTLYKEFGDKQSLFLAALEIYIAEAEISAAQFLGREPLGVENIKDFFRLIGQRAEPRGCLLTLTINENNLVSAGAFAKAIGLFDRLEMSFRNNLLHDEAAAFSPDQCRVLAKYLVVSMQGLATSAKTNPHLEDIKLVIETILLPLTLPGNRKAKEVAIQA